MSERAEQIAATESIRLAFPKVSQRQLARDIYDQSGYIDGDDSPITTNQLRQADGSFYGDIVPEATIYGRIRRYDKGVAEAKAGAEREAAIAFA